LIRLATPADVPYILQLERACSFAPHWTEQQYRQLFEPAVEHGVERAGAERLVLVAGTLFDSAPGRVTIPGVDPNFLGFLIALHLGPEWELENLVVAPSSRRQGLGMRLLDTLLAKARETNSKSVFLEVRGSNAAARSLYEKAGFGQIGRRKSYYKDPAEDSLLYRLGLD
jgi:ribosomal-protein-alanine N-acetyltransferase